MINQIFDHNDDFNFFATDNYIVRRTRRLFSDSSMTYYRLYFKI